MSAGRNRCAAVPPIAAGRGKGKYIMKRSHFIRALLAGSAIVASSAAWAQEPAAQPDPSDATADAAIAEAQQLDDAQAKIELLQAQVEALQESIAQLQAAQAKVTP